jgi:RHS repeat-associated protein
VWLGEKILWVNRAGNFPPTSGQALPYTILDYDGDGRLIRRERRTVTSGPIQVLELYWDGGDHLRQVKENGVVVFTAAYNGEGLRVSKWDLWTGQHDYTWGPAGVLYDSNGATVYTPGLAQRSGSTDRLVHTDWLGSTRWMSDGANGNSFPVYALFDSFGNRHTDVTTPGSFSPFQWGGAVGYQSEYADPSVPGLGLVYMEQRYYDPAIGRFISPDPIGYAGGLNLYAYVGNNPTNLVDRLGLYAAYPDRYGGGGGGPLPPSAYLVAGGGFASAAAEEGGLAVGFEPGVVEAPGRFPEALAPEPGVPGEGGVPCEAAEEGIGEFSPTPWTDLMEAGEAARYAKYWQNYAPRQVEPGIGRLDWRRFSGRTNRFEDSRAIYDPFGRQRFRIDFRDHMRPESHSSPHLHEYQYGPGFHPVKGREILHNLW